ncbi:MAG: hypothetical protein RMJ15_02985 [Nitrososphaerota archaeon]|nr:hypothetical protein [Candidatus Bathyarchaeota archaeon]MDW8022692.1 hypothetical protein [Nitrososphaerota archaeon]
MAWLLEREIKRELPEEWGGVVPTEVFLKEAHEIVEKAMREGLTLRILGGLAVAIHSQNQKDFARKLGRTGTGMVKGQEYSDIDFIAYSGQRNRIKEFFEKLGYAKRRATLSTAASERQIYYHPQGWFYVDVFFDKLLVANHPIDFRGRLELDYPTITVTDMLLEKIQMWEAFSLKDLKDCLLLLKAHSVGEGKEKEQIDASYIAKLLAQDWGFWYTATTNLKKLRKFISELDTLGKEAEIDPAGIDVNDREELMQKLNVLLERIEKEPKTIGWKMRAKIGTKKKWYNPVERPETVGGFGIWEALLKGES